MLAKLSEGENENWDLVLNQSLTTIRFSINRSNKFSPYYTLFGQNVVIPIDNLLRPRKYVKEEHHKIIIEQQYKVFVQDRNGIYQDLEE